MSKAEELAKELLGVIDGPAFHVPNYMARQAAAQQEPAKPMDAHLAAYFMRRFLHEEKMLGPNEQAALQFTIAALEALESAQHHEQPQQERKPMTDEERHALFAGLLSETVDTPTEMFRLIVERVERHHGIFAEPAQGIKEQK